MHDQILEFANQFPIVEYNPDRLEPPQVNLVPYLIELFEIAGYSEAEIQQSVEIEVPDDAYEPTDMDHTGSITFPVYVSEVGEESAYMVGYEQPIIPPLSERGLDHVDYEQMRLHHDVSGADITLCLTPFDLLVYEGRPLFAGDPPEPPITSYPLHENLDRPVAERLFADIEASSDLS